MAVSSTQLLLLACFIAMSEGLTCDDLTCCTGTVCQEKTRKNGNIVAKCVAPASCNDLECPVGFVCVNETDEDSTKPAGASCQANCNDVQCPGFLQCEAEGSTAECAVPDTCSLVTCPSGTECKTIRKNGERVAVCVGGSCDSVTCFSGSECIITSRRDLNAYLPFSGGMVKRDSSRSGFASGQPGSGGSGGEEEGGSGSGQPGSGGSGEEEEEEGGSGSGQPGSGGSGGEEEEEEGSSGSGQPGSGGSGGEEEEEEEESGSGGTGQQGGAGSQGSDVAICVPTCAGSNICPQGFVCEEDDYKLVCREAQRCAEVQCPAGQECQETPCGVSRARRSSSRTKPKQGTQDSLLLQCVNSPDVGGDVNSVGDQSSLERIGNEGQADITSGAKLAYAAVTLVLSMCAFLMLAL